MGTYLKCFLITVFTFVPAALVAKYFSNDLGIAFILGVFLISIIAIIFYAPKNSPLNQISDKKAKTLKRLSVVSLTIWFIISVCLYFFQQMELTISVSIGVLLEVSSIIPAFEMLYNKLDKIGAER